MQNEFWAADDTVFHLSRIEGLAQSIKLNNWFPKIYIGKLNGYGYALPLFYSDLTLIFPAILFLNGFSIISSFKIFVFLVSFFSSVSIGYTSMKLTDNLRISSLSIILYILAQYRLCIIYNRGALGELIGLIFFPLIILWLYDFIKNRSVKISLLVFSFVGLLLSHNISFVLGCFLFGLLLIVFYRHWIFDIRKIIKLVASIIFTILITMYYIAPLIEMYSSQNFLVFSGSSDGLILEDNSVKVYNILTDTIISFKSSNYNPISLGFPLTLLIIFILYKNKYGRMFLDKFNLILFIFGLIYFFLITNIIPWKYLSILSIIQFPYRILTLSITCLSISIPYFINKIFNKKYIIIFIIMLLFYSYDIFKIYNYEKDYSDSISYYDLITSKENGKEYLYDNPISISGVNELAGRNFLNPLMIDENQWENNITNVAGETISKDVYKDGIATSFNVTFYIPNEYIVFPLIYYKGYTANCIDLEGRIVPLETEFDLDSARVKVKIDNPDFLGKISVWYEETQIQKISIKISTYSLIICLIYRLAVTIFYKLLKK